MNVITNSVGCNASVMSDPHPSHPTEVTGVVHESDAAADASASQDVFSLGYPSRIPRLSCGISPRLRALLERARGGTRVVYVPGNHDRPFRDFHGWVLGQVEILKEAVHETADGRRFLVLHGDEFDSGIRASPLLESLGNRAYALVLRLNRYVNAVRRRLGYPYWSMAAFLKHKVKNAVSYIANFERAVAFEARRRGVDGMICGHIHRATITDIDGITYCNDRDWVESCTALVEDFDGRFALLRWTEESRLIAASAQDGPTRRRLQGVLAA